VIATSETLDKFAPAMAAVQADIGGAVKGSLNPAFKSRYADLGAVWDAWQAIGPKAGFAVMQFPGLYDADSKTMAMTTLITHSSGQWVKSDLSVPLSKVDAQGYGSATTYARRYSLAAAVGICPEDDDGNAASRGANSNTREPAQPVITDDQATALRDLIREARTTEAGFCQHVNVRRLEDLTAANFDRAKGVLNARIEKIKEAA
jgi:hypothetical protein